MKKGFLLLVLLAAALTAQCQKTVKIRNLWTRPQIHVHFKEYTVSFSVRDIDRALELLNGTGDYTYGTKSDLDSTKDFTIELLNDLHTEYKVALQPMLQNSIGTFLLTKGLAVITTPKHKKTRTLQSVIMDYDDLDATETNIFIHFYDPDNHHLLFTGKLPLALYNLDMGIDYY